MVETRWQGLLLRPGGCLHAIKCAASSDQSVQCSGMVEQRMCSPVGLVEQRLTHKDQLAV